MSSGGWKIPPITRFPLPPPIIDLTSTPRKGFNVQISQRNFYRDDWNGVSNYHQQEIKVSPHKYEVNESRAYTVDQPRVNLLNRYTSDAKKVQKKKNPTIDKRKKINAVKPTDNSPSARVKMEIYLERFNTGVFITKVKVGERVRWQNVKYEKQALRYHPAIKRSQTVMSTVETMKNHRTLQISLTKNEAERYRAGDLLEGTTKPKPQTGITCQQVNNYYQQSTYVYNAGPSTSTHCIEDNNNEFSGSDSESDNDYYDY